MGIKSRIFNNARRPEGLIGKMMANGMNGGSHKELALWGMSKFVISGDVLDIGCGGGGNIDRMLSMDGVISAKGLDHSDVSVEKSKRTNAKAISDGRCMIIKGTVNSMPFDDCSFDTVTAFETVYFWTDIGDAFIEVFRVLRAGGTFAIINESDGVDQASVKYSEIIDGMNLYTPDMLKELLAQAGFSDIECFSSDNSKPWICVVGRKR